MPCWSRPSLALNHEEILSTSHEVFVSFRGKDTRQGFVSHLLSALIRNNIKTYIDEIDLERGNEISSTLSKAIEESKISLIVFSRNYASSKWTMDELMSIISCRRKGQLVIPIFYRTSPSELKRKTSYSVVIKKQLPNVSNKSEIKEIEQKWRKAMVEAVGIAGWSSSNYRTEAELVEVIAMEVKSKLKSMSHEQGSEGLQLQPYSGGSSNDDDDDDDDPIPHNSSLTSKCLLPNGALNLLAYLGDKARGVFLRKGYGTRLILTTIGQQPSSLYTTYGYFYRNPYTAKR